MNIKDYLKRNGMTLILLVGMIILYLCIPSQIAENMVAKATISPRFFPTFSVLGVIVCCALLLVFDAKEHILSRQSKENCSGGCFSTLEPLRVIVGHFRYGISETNRFVNRFCSIATTANSHSGAVAPAIIGARMRRSYPTGEAAAETAVRIFPANLLHTFYGLL